MVASGAAGMQGCVPHADTGIHPCTGSVGPLGIMYLVHSKDSMQVTVPSVKQGQKHRGVEFLDE